MSFGPGRLGWLKKATPNRSGRLSALRPALAGGAPGLWASNHLLESRRCTGWVYVAVHSFALQFAQAHVACYQARPPRRPPLPDDPLEALEARLQRLRGKSAPDHPHAGRVQRRPLPETHPLPRLLHSPNRWQSGRVFRYQVGQQLALTGQALIWAVRDRAADRPQELYVIPTGVAVPQPPSADYPEGYYRILPVAAYGTLPEEQDGFIPGTLGTLLMQGGEVPRRAVRAIRWPHPLYLSDSLSPLAAGTLQVDVAEQVLLSIHARFRNEARIGLLLKWSSPEAHHRVSDEDMDAFREMLRSRNSGAANAGRDLLLPPGLEAEAYEPTPDEMAYHHAWPLVRDGVFNLFGLPGVAAGVDGAGNYSAYYAQLQQYTDLAVQPMLELAFGELSEELGPPFGRGLEIEARARAINDPTLQGQAQDRHLRAQALTIDEYRALNGFPPHPDPRMGKQPAGQVRLPAADGKTSSAIEGNANPDATDTGMRNPLRDAVPGQGDIIQKTCKPQSQLIDDDGSEHD